MNHLQKLYKFFKTCVSVNYNLCAKLVSSLEFLIKFDERFKVTSVPFFISDFNLLNCELDNFTLSLLYSVIYINILLK